VSTMTNENTASPRQIDFINRLKGERHWLAYDPEDHVGNVARAQDEPEAYVAGVTLAVARDMWRKGEFTKSVASQTIEALLAAPEKPKAQPEVIDPIVNHGDGSMSFAPMQPKVEDGPAPEGMHKFGGVIFKVQRAVHGSGRPYAQALVEAPGSDSGWTFEYVPGAIKNLSSATKLSLAEAKAFGALYGTCCACGRTLTNEDSIAAGIGPVCADKF
jgi:hypothetical protein